MTSFPSMLYGSNGEQYKTYTDKRWPLGTQLVLQDGRKFRFALNGAVTGVAGNVYQQAVPVADHVGLTVQAVSAIGAHTISATLGGSTVAAANLYAEGFISITATPGMGYCYKIASHPAVGAGGVITVTLDPNETVQVALSTATTCDLFRNPYAGVVIAPITTRTSPPIGVMMKPLTATTTYGWLQTRGACNVLANGTLVVGDMAVSPAGAAGAVMPAAAGNSEVALSTRVGQVMAVGSTYTTLFLELDG